MEKTITCGFDELSEVYGWDKNVAAKYDFFFLFFKKKYFFVIVRFRNRFRCEATVNLLIGGIGEDTKKDFYTTL